jgi:hypothetical protein
VNFSPAGGYEYKLDMPIKRDDARLTPEGIGELDTMCTQVGKDVGYLGRRTRFHVLPNSEGEPSIKYRKHSAKQDNGEVVLRPCKQVGRARRRHPEIAGTYDEIAGERLCSNGSRPKI